MSRLAITRPASRRVSPRSSPGSSPSTSARTDATSTRSGKRFGRDIASSLSPPRGRASPVLVRALMGESRRRSRGAEGADLCGPNLHDLELERAARRRDLDRLALLVADDRLADRRLVGELVLRRVRFRRADDVVLEGLLRLDVAELHVGAEGDDVLRDLLLLDHAGRQEALLELGDPMLEHRLLVLGVVVLRVLGDVAELPGDPDAVGHLPPLVAAEVVDLLLQLLVSLFGEDDFLQDCPFSCPKRGAQAPPRIGKCSLVGQGSSTPGGATIPRSMQAKREPSQVDLHESWWIRDVEIPTRLVLAPMAGVSVQAFRRQGRRYGAGLVCSEMVSCAGIEHRNEKTLGYLRVASDEHPLAIQLFGSEPRAMADAARLVEAVGADIVDVNFGCPVKKVTKTGAGAHLLEDQDLACRIIAAIAGAVSVPVTVKLRRGVQNGSRAALELGPRLVEAGASSLTLHPRSAQQM